MTRAFHDKIEVERRVIQATNSAFPDVEQLAGLTRAAIERWASANRGKVPDSIAVDLLTLSHACRRFADLSGEMYEELPAVERERLDATAAIFVSRLNDPSITGRGKTTGNIP
jgi:hypothetical protein